MGMTTLNGASLSTYNTCVVKARNRGRECLRRLAIVLSYLVCVGAGGVRAEEQIAFYYGAKLPVDELRAFDIVVVEPDHSHDPKQYKTANSELFAYVSVGEINPQRSYAASIPSTWIIGDNPAWASKIIDQAQSAWPDFLVQRIITPLWQRGYRGFFLDTLDSYQLAAKDASERARQELGLQKAILAIRNRYPEAKLIFNRGFEILPALHRHVFAVAAESLFHGWNNATQRYVEVTETDRAWLSAKLNKIKKDYNLPIIVIDYVAPQQRRLALQIAEKIAALGFMPWVSNPALDMVGVGKLEVIPRKVLMLYDANESTDLAEQEIVRYAAMPLNYLGYVPEYIDINGPLPAFPLRGRYAGIVSWLNSDAAGNPVALQQWLAQQVNAGMRVVVLGRFGFPLNDATLAPFGLRLGESAAAPGPVSISMQQSPLGFEAQPYPDRRSFMPLRLQPPGRVLLQLRNSAQALQDAVAYTAWGGYALTPYVLLPLSAELGFRWIIQPLEFFKQALALQPMPVPDTTTENGQRLLLVHIDGDGFANRAEMPGSPFAAQQLYDEILQRYRLPTTMSVIQGEIAENGLNPQLAPRLEALARRIFALPHVELASHSYSHPFRWPLQNNATNSGYSLDIPGYRFAAETEINGSIAYINRHLAPAGKSCKVFLWSGDTNPSASILRRTYQIGIANMNGGDTTITDSDNSWTRIAPLGLARGDYFQVYAPNQNENIYTHSWTGPFYGYERVIETFKLTDTPFRFKPINIYYHVYSASKPAALRALGKVYDWALTQAAMPVYASEYIAKVGDFNRISIARAGSTWVIRGAHKLRQLRIPQALGYPVPDAGNGIIGFTPAGAVTYVHMSGRHEQRLRLTNEPPQMPYLVSSNGEVRAWKRVARGFDAALRAYAPLKIGLANVSGCQVSADGQRLKALRLPSNFNQYALPQHAIETLSVRCQG